MREAQTGSIAAVTFRLYPGTHAIVKALAGIEGVSMVEFVDRVVRDEAARQGFSVREVEPHPSYEIENREILIPAR